MEYADTRGVEDRPREAMSPNKNANGPGNGIGWAIKQLNNGQAVTRSGWHDQGMFLRLVGRWLPSQGDDGLTVPCLVLNMDTGYGVPWCPSQTDLMATDWYFHEAK